MISADGAYSVIDNNVLKFNYNSSYIILNTFNYKNTGEESLDYWIIDKSIPVNMDDCNNQESCGELLKSNVEGPIDSLNFYRRLKERDIKLTFDVKTAN